VISRIKIMAGLNIAERRLAQDGRIRDQQFDQREPTNRPALSHRANLRLHQAGVNPPR
jgi:hypothetical protein